MLVETAREGRLFRLTLNRPEKRNALNLEMCRLLVAAIGEAGEDARVGAILITGTGTAFCAGMDLSEAPDADRAALAEAHDRLFTIGEWTKKPIVAAVQGPAIAGGTGLAANAHLVIAATDAKFGLTEVRLGLWPVLIFPAIAAAVGERRATELALTGRLFDAPEALQLGLATEVVAADQLQTRANEVATSIANASAVAVRLGLDYVRNIRGHSTEEALATGRVIRDQIMAHPDFAEGVRAFHEKRASVWPSHRG